MFRFTQVILKFFTLFVFLSILLLGNNPISASSIINTENTALNFNDLAKNSKWICLARVKKIRSYYRDLKNEELTLFQGRHTQMLESSITFELEHNYKGSLEQEFTLEISGGCVLGQCFQMSLSPQFRAGQRVILFLTTFSDSQKQLAFGDEGVFEINQANQIEKLNLSIDQFEQELKSLNY